MEFPFSFDITNVRAIDGKVVIKLIREEGDEHLEVTYKTGDLDQVAKLLRKANREAKRQARTQKKLERFAKKHTEIDQD